MADPLDDTSEDTEASLWRELGEGHTEQELEVLRDLSAEQIKLVAGRSASDIAAIHEAVDTCQGEYGMSKLKMAR